MLLCISKEQLKIKSINNAAYNSIKNINTYNKINKRFAGPIDVRLQILKEKEN